MSEWFLVFPSVHKVIPTAPFSHPPDAHSPPSAHWLRPADHLRKGQGVRNMYSKTWPKYFPSHRSAFAFPKQQKSLFPWQLFHCMNIIPCTHVCVCVFHRCTTVWISYHVLMCVYVCVHVYSIDVPLYEYHTMYSCVCVCVFHRCTIYYRFKWLHAL